MFPEKDTRQLRSLVVEHATTYADRLYSPPSNERTELFEPPRPTQRNAFDIVARNKFPSVGRPTRTCCVLYSKWTRSGARESVRERAMRSPGIRLIQRNTVLDGGRPEGMHVEGRRGPRRGRELFRLVEFSSRRRQKERKSCCPIEIPPCSRGSSTRCEYDFYSSSLPPPCQEHWIRVKLWSMEACQCVIKGFRSRFHAIKLCRWLRGEKEKKIVCELME